MSIWFHCHNMAINRLIWVLLWSLWPIDKWSLYQRIYLLHWSSTEKKKLWNFHSKKCLTNSNILTIIEMLTIIDIIRYATLKYAMHMCINGMHSMPIIFALIELKIKQLNECDTMIKLERKIGYIGKYN